MAIKKLTLLLIAISVSSLLQAQQVLSNEQNQVQQAVVKMFEALSNRDSTSLKAHCTTEITLYEYGQIWNIDTLINKAIIMNTATDFKRTNSFNFISTAVDNNTASTMYYLTSIINKDGKQTTIQWLETVLLIKEQHRWRVNHLHSTLISRN